MRVLLDTHALLWTLLDDPKLSQHARSVVSDLGNNVLYSPASYWELAIKISLGKYDLNEDFAVFLERETALADLTILPITIRHAAVLAGLPFHHKDPFDRMLVSQALFENIPIVSRDAALDAYGVSRIW